MAENKFTRIDMVGYNNMKEMASFAFLDNHGASKKIYMTRFTFEHMVTPGAWNKTRLGDISPTQNEFMDILKAHVTDEPLMTWFDRRANECAMAYSMV